MKHANTRALYDYWDGLRATRPAPLRSELDPRAIKTLLPNMFILQRLSSITYTFRLAGTDLCHLFGRELRNENFLEDWKANEVRSIRSLFESIVEDKAAAVLGVKAFADTGEESLMEYLLVPVKLDATSETRILGCGSVLEAASTQYRPNIAHQEVTGLRLLWPNQEGRFLVDDAPVQGPTLVQDNARAPHKEAEKRGHLWVIEGGVG